jgi:hypothetical protein
MGRARKLLAQSEPDLVAVGRLVRAARDNGNFKTFCDAVSLHPRKAYDLIAIADAVEDGRLQAAEEHACSTARVFPRGRGWGETRHEELQPDGAPGAATRKRTGSSGGSEAPWSSRQSCRSSHDRPPWIPPANEALSAWRSAMTGFGGSPFGGTAVAYATSGHEGCRRPFGASGILINLTPYIIYVQMKPSSSRNRVPMHGKVTALP